MAQKNDVVHASECKCCVCGEQAVAFWPVIDPDIPSNPYCRKCLDKAQLELMRRITNEEKRQPTNHR